MTILCNYINNGSYFKCSTCGDIRTKKVIRNCSLKESIKVPDLPERLFNFSVAAISHFLNGNPTCTQEEIDKRLEICRKCERFKSNDNGETGICAHENCGCNIKSAQIYLNKLAWSDQSCPIGKWGPISK